MKNGFFKAIANVGGAPSGPSIAASIVGSANQYLGINVGNGWWMQMTMPNVTTGGTYSLTPDATPKVSFNVTRQGYDASGNTTTVAESVFATQTIKNSYPNDATIQETQVSSDVVTNLSVSSEIYQGDTIGSGNVLSGAYTGLVAAPLSITNNSNLSYPKVIADWALVPKREWTSDLVLEVVAYHKHGRNGRGVAAVIITGFDGTNTVTKTCTYVKSSDNLGVYQATFNTSEFISGNDVTFNFVAYPWVGDSGATLDTSGGTFPSVTQTCGQVYRNGAISNLKYAYVLTTGNDGTGAVQNDRATAKTTPYLTIAAAMAGMFAAKNDLSQCVLYVGAGTFNWPSANITGATRNAPNGWYVVEGDPDDANPKANCIIQTVGATYVQVFNNGAGTMSWLQMKNLTVNIIATFQGLLSGNSGRATLWMDNVNLNNNLTTTTAWCSGVFNYFTGVNGQAPNQTARVMQANSTNVRPQLIRNCTTNRALGANVILSSTADTTTGQVTLGEATNMRGQNLIAANVKLTEYSGSSAAINLPLASGAYTNIAVSQCVFSAASTNAQPLLAFGENVTDDVTNCVFEYITTANGLDQTAMRFNIHNDPPNAEFPTTTSSPQAVYTNLHLSNNLFQWVAIKDDRFSGANEGNTGANLVVQGWPKRYGVSWRDNASAYTPDEWIPEYFGVGSLRAQARAFGSNFVPTSGFATCAVQSQTWDLAGSTRRTDGTGASGAMES